MVVYTATHNVELSGLQRPRRKDENGKDSDERQRNRAHDAADERRPAGRGVRVVQQQHGLPAGSGKAPGAR